VLKNVRYASNAHVKKAVKQQNERAAGEKFTATFSFS